MSPDKPYKADNDQIVFEAASWIAQLDSGKFSHADRMALAEWMARSPRHEAEIRKLTSIWGDIDKHLDQHFGTPKKATIFSVIRAWIIVKPMQFSGASAALMAIIVAITIGALNWFGKTPADFNSLIVQVDQGESKTVTMDDGSTIQLNTSTIAEIEDSSRARLVRLLQGEGFFRVERDPKRPFQVIAGGGVVEAIGTEFYVRRHRSKINVVVSEGSVKFARTSAADGNPTSPGPVSIDAASSEVVKAGYKAQLAANEIQVVRIEAAVMQRETAWIDGVLIFDGQTLEEIIAEVSRYTNDQIVLSDADLRNLKMSGVFPTSQIDALLGALTASLDVEVIRTPDGVIYLQKTKEKEN